MGECLGAPQSPPPQFWEQFLPAPSFSLRRSLSKLFWLKVFFYLNSRSEEKQDKDTGENEAETDILDIYIWKSIKINKIIFKRKKKKKKKLLSKKKKKKKKKKS